MKIILLASPLLLIIGVAVWYFMFREQEETGESASADASAAESATESSGDTNTESVPKGVKCQFIKVMNGHNVGAGDQKNYLNFAEIEALDEKGNNVALNKTTTQSSEYSKDYPGSNAVDGKHDNFMHTKDGVNEWWQVDLGQEQYITQIKFYHRQNCCQERDTGAKIQLIASDGKTVVHEVIVRAFKDNKQLDEHDLTN